ncbi:hypothetical protein VB618_10245 [Microvirga sp. CF3062]|uniref:hypothetical protein n=1 Tax=Microvirga sp. CF3062 TaxID=3110182 RepID=UPI002E78DA22|nr:hypothetical protein [Microvirga sp. CF3062]MEE1656579.1 hypothetical protein [Microvirga sp. CF3062]
MLKKSDIQPSPCGSEDLEYYKSLARLAERRARDIRRIAALEREQLEKHAVDRGITMAKAELEELRRTHTILATSRAHALANAYIRLATGDSFFAKALQPLRLIAHMVFPQTPGV